MTQTSEITENKCPFCKRSMTAEEYEQAVKANQQEMNQQMAEERKRLEDETQRKIEQADIQREKRYEEEEKLQQKKIDDLKKLYQDQVEDLKNEMDKMYKENLSTIKETEEKIHKQDLEIKDKEITQLKDERARMKQAGYDEAKADGERVIAAKDLEIKEQQILLGRAQKDLEETRNKLSQSQPDVKGMAGEYNLKSVLTDAFPDDLFKEQTPGTNAADLTQVIRVNGEELEIPICYDNKEAKNVGPKERDKAKNYKKIHNTNHVIIVTRNISTKEIENGAIGEIDGVLHVHPRILVEVVTQIRSLIIENSRDMKNQKDRDSKEAQLYDYITSQEYVRLVEKVLEVYDKMNAMQISEEKGHQTLWKARKALHDHLSDIYKEISSGVNHITQEPSTIKPKQMRKSKKTKIKPHKVF